MNQDTTGADAGAGDATLLLSLDGLAVTGVERSAAGVAQATLVLPCTGVRPQVVHRVDARDPGRRADHGPAAGAYR